MKAAVIGIGSNSVRCLLAETGEDGFTCLWRDREGTRLFAGLDERGNLSRESMDKTVAAVARMASEVRHQRAEKLGVFATSAARDAANGEEFIRAVAEAAETEPQILPGNEEAELSFLGASAAVKDGRCGVVDIGGGSTEFAIGTREGIEASFSCQMGAVRRRPGSGPAGHSPRWRRWRAECPGLTGRTCTERRSPGGRSRRSARSWLR